jgi:hypothetical protein
MVKFTRVLCDIRKPIERNKGRPAGDPGSLNGLLRHRGDRDVLHLYIASVRSGRRLPGKRNGLRCRRTLAVTPAIAKGNSS